MIYQLRVDSVLLEHELESVTATNRIRMAMLAQDPSRRIEILRDGREMSEAELAGDLKSEEVRASMEESAALPSTYRRGRTEHGSDLSVGPDGQRYGAWKPQNPEDRYE